MRVLDIILSSLSGAYNYRFKLNTSMKSDSNKKKHEGEMQKEIKKEALKYGRNLYICLYVFIPF